MNNLKKIFQRDEFIKVVYQAAKKNNKIYFLSADFGAPALDNFRRYLKKQFLHLGICEQNMIDFACGMALEGAKVYAYAMAPFLSLRCLEQHKTATCLMNANVCSIITGIGLSYANSGPTHYSTEDFACLRSLSNCAIFTASDPDTAKLIAKKTLKLTTPIFVRLDRKASNNLSKKIGIKDINAGFRYLKKSSRNKLLVISHGTIIERALIAEKNLDKKFSSQTLTDLKETQSQLAGHRERFIYLQEALSRVVLKSPVDGVVNNLNFHTVGSSIPPGQTIVEISPVNDLLVIEAKIEPKSIDSITVGLISKIRFSAFKSRTTPSFTGKVISLSPDLITDHQRGPGDPLASGYYLARIEIDMDKFQEVADSRKLELHPGMPAEVQIVTGTRTLLRYLLDPVIDAMFKGFKEK